MEAIYRVIQTPLQGMTDSLGGALLMCFAGPFLWIFGVHGSTVVGGIMSGLLQANSLANQAILDSGLELTVANGGHIVTQQFYDQYINVTGAGITIGLVIYLVLFAKSKQLKTLGKVEAVPALFGINEPILFGYEPYDCGAICGYAFDFLCDSVFCSLLWNMPSVWCDSGSMDLSAYYLRIFSGRMEKRFIAGCDLSYIILCVSAFHQAD